MAGGILVKDDHARLSRMVVDCLAGAGFAVESRGAGAAGIAAVESGRQMR